MREAERAGHQAATTAVPTARAMAAATAHQVMSYRSMRWATMVSSLGANASHAASPAAVPATAAVAPTAAPLASITRRIWRSVAPSDPSMPSARRRR